VSRIVWTPDTGWHDGPDGVRVYNIDGKFVAGECARWHALDKKFKTDKRSPLHHDNRCQECKAK
jgi:hypothetical protein